MLSSDFFQRKKENSGKKELLEGNQDEKERNTFEEVDIGQST